MPRGFPYFLQLEPKFYNKDLSHSHIQDLFLLTVLNTLSLDAKNIINLISVLTIWWCPCVESCLVLWCLLWPVGSLDKTLLTFAPLHFVLQGQTCYSRYLLLQVSPNFLLLHSSSLWCTGHHIFVLVLGGLVGHHRMVQLQLFSTLVAGA